jgi:hypothetical protein
VGGKDLDALLLEGLLESLRDLGVFDRQQVGKHFNHGHLGPEGVVEVGEFHSDCAGANDHQTFRLLRQDHGFLAGDHGFAIEGEAGHRSGQAACGD